MMMSSEDEDDTGSSGVGQHEESSKVEIKLKNEPKDVITSSHPIGQKADPDIWPSSSVQSEFAHPPVPNVWLFGASDYGDPGAASAARIYEYREDVITSSPSKLVTGFSQSSSRGRILHTISAGSTNECTISTY